MRQHRLRWAAGCIALAMWAAPTWAVPTTANVDATITVFAAISFSPAPVAFGSQQIGTSATKSVTITNNGSASLSLSVGLSHSGDFTLSNGCGGSLAGGASCQVSVTYSPSAAGSSATTITVNAAGHSYDDTVIGTGTVQPPVATPVSIALSPSSIQIQDNATGGSIVSVATVTCSDGTTSCPYTLSTSDTRYYQISGNNVVLAHSLSSADDGSHPTTITAQ